MSCEQSPECGCAPGTCVRLKCAHCGEACTGKEEAPPPEVYAANVRFCEACLKGARMRAAAITKGFRVGS